MTGVGVYRHRSLRADLPVLFAALMGPAMKNALPHSHYPTRDGRWIAIACTNDKIFARLADLMGMPEVSVKENGGRSQNATQIVPQ